nr:MAG TPA_asm: hypothetical protein [Caudoviricetes sp.]
MHNFAILQWIICKACATRRRCCTWVYLLPCAAGVAGRGWGISWAGAVPGKPQNARKKQKRKNTCALHKLKLTY